ncbi:thiocillin family RiPP [Streptomyces sp. NBC_01077]|uniref:thiocillin family RiPP n=1 Tax=Streptomyces sp. NBC_01077 TaxID=2903746 RepID=UPI00386B4CFC|nr:thiocillin family RiPP [Streptomyces sp. NBC_01077]WSV43652.1 thiocillin family RiPP [Streptomyces sp. NBC_01077]
MGNEFDLYAVESDLGIEALPEGNAPSDCFATYGSATTASCPLTSASSVSTASTLSGGGDLVPR